MANYLINSPSSETVGTNSNDLFVLQAIQGVSVFGLEGNDIISATTLNGSAALLNAGAGNDSIVLTAAGGNLFQGSVFAGAGNDRITANQDFSAAVLRGGSGNDTIILQAVATNALDKTTVGGNDNADLLQGIVETGSNSSFFAAGKGADTVDLIFSGANAFTINGGAGHDSINLSAAGSLSSFIVAGGDGFDTITFEAGAAAAISANSNINGDALNDLMTFQGAVATIVGSATIGAGDGADTIRFSAGVGLANGFINAGAGLDSVYISAQFSAGTLNGGAGSDSITLASFGASGSNAGVIFGDAGADAVNLGTRAAEDAANTGATINSGASFVGYSNFDQSNLAAFDTVSAAYAGNGTLTGSTVALFKVSQTVVNFTAAGNTQVQGVFSAQGNGQVLFNGAFDGTLTARVTELDKVLTRGMAVSFTNGAGQDFLFVQGGGATGGTSDDLLTQINGSNTALTVNVANNSSITIRQSAFFA